MMNSQPEKQSKPFLGQYGRLLAMFLVSSVLFAILAIAVTDGVTSNFDNAILLWINQHSDQALNGFFKLATHLGGAIFVIIVTLVLGIFLAYKKKYNKAAFLGLAVGGVAVGNYLLKGLFGRARPDLWEKIVNETYYSFPSGHASASFALAVCVVLIFWRTRWRIPATIISALYVLTVGASRLYLGVHYPSDVLGGWIFGLTLIMLFATVFSYIRFRSGRVNR